MAASLAGILNSACALQLTRVETTDGRFLGHVFDLRGCWTPGQTEEPVVEEVVYGRSGWLERVGLGPHRCDTLPWSAVRSIDNGVMRVDAAAVDAARKR